VLGPTLTRWALESELISFSSSWNKFSYVWFLSCLSNFFVGPVISIVGRSFVGSATVYPTTSKLVTEQEEEEIFSNFLGLFILGTRDGTLEKDLLLSFVSIILVIFSGYFFLNLKDPPTILCSCRSND
jgi:hypothetical protein